MDEARERNDPALEPRMRAVRRLTDDLAEYYPKTVLLFGSMARYLAGDRSKGLPNDIDVMYVGVMSPERVKSKDYGAAFDLQVFRPDQFIAIARSLRYDARPAALAKLYSGNVVKQHSRDVIAACMMLGPTYNDFGFEQIEIDGKADPRDYSVHRVLHGREWWERLSAFARERRGPLKRFSDKIFNGDVFE